MHWTTHLRLRHGLRTLTQVSFLLALLASSNAAALSFTATADTSNFGVGSNVQISIGLALGPTEELSALEASFQIVGLAGVSVLSLAYDPGGLFQIVAGNQATDLITLSYTRDNSVLDGVLAQLVVSVTQAESFSIVLGDVPVASKDIPASPYFADLTTTPFAGTPLLTLGLANSFQALEDFEALALQNDTTGAMVGGVRVYSIVDGNNSVASVEGALAAGTAIAQSGGPRYWTLSSASGDTTSSSGLLLIGDLPAMDGGIASGSFATSFVSPADLIQTEVDASLRSPNGTGNTSVRAVLMDQSGREVATPLVALGASFAPYRFLVHEDFTDLLAGASGFSFTQVVGVALEFHSSLASAPGYDFDVDQIAVTAQPVPEPAAAQGLAAALFTLAGLLGYRSRSRSAEAGVRALDAEPLFG